MVIWYILAFAIAMLYSLAFTPIARTLAFRHGAVDYPDSRKIHVTPMPRFGGISIIGSLFLALTTLWLLSGNTFPRTGLSPLREYAFCIGAIVVFLLGAYDDLHGVSPKKKLAIECLAGLIVHWAGVSFFASMIGPDRLGTGLAIVDCGLSVLWIVGSTNAMNLIDGLDGLASGVGLIACLTVLPFAVWNNDPVMGLLALVLAGSLLGFLYYNFNPAKIFLGDSGSLLVGFLLGILSIKCVAPVCDGYFAFIPFLVLGFPVIDTLLAIVRRLLRSLCSEQPRGGGFVERLKPIFYPDRNHIHHKLIAMGLSQRKAVLSLYAVSCGLGLCAIMLSRTNPEYGWIVFIAILAGAFTAIGHLGYKDLAIIENGYILTVFDHILHRSKYQAAFDVGIIVASFTLSYAIQRWTQVPVVSQEIVYSGVILMIVQTAVLGVSDLYDHSFTFPLAENVYFILKRVSFAVLATWVLSSIARPSTLEATRLCCLQIFVSS